MVSVDKSGDLPCLVSVISSVVRPLWHLYVHFADDPTSAEHLAQPIKSPPFILSSPRSSPFSLADLGSSLPVDSRPVSPTDSQASFSSGLVRSL